FLPQPGMEGAFLHALSGELAAASGVGSFNGASFDLPILRTRWVMARMHGDLQHPPHVDLLTLVRSLYRHRMESCTLRSVEERLLGYEREDPIGGALAPDAYFQYVHHGPSRLLELVLEHNRLDVISLVHLHSLLLRRLRGADAGMDASGSGERSSPARDQTVAATRTVAAAIAGRAVRGRPGSMPPSRTVRARASTRAGSNSEPPPAFSSWSAFSGVSRSRPRPAVMFS